MNRPARLLTLILLGVSLTAPAHAVQDPRAGRYDQRIKTVAYNGMNVVRVIGSALSSMEIIFSSKEVITQVAIGDSDAWLAQPAGNLLFLKPTEIRAPTNAQIVTKRPDGSLRSYQFELVARDSTAATDQPDAGSQFAIMFTYPNDDRQAASEAQERALEKFGERIAQQRLAETFINAPKNWRYTAQGSAAIQPAEVSDDGRMTGFRFPGNASLPTIYTVAADGQETITPYSINDDLVLVQTTAREFRLRLGGEILRIFNLGFDPVGRNPGTTSPDVVRTIAAARQ